MSDTEGAPRKSGYRVEYASSARAKCKGWFESRFHPVQRGAQLLYSTGPKPCSGRIIGLGHLFELTFLSCSLGTSIAKGEMRLGTLIEVRGATT